MNSRRMHELVRMVPEAKNLLKKLSKCTMGKQTMSVKVD